MNYLFLIIHKIIVDTISRYATIASLKRGNNASNEKESRMKITPEEVKNIYSSYDIKISAEDCIGMASHCNALNNLVEKDYFGNYTKAKTAIQWCEEFAKTEAEEAK